MWDGGQSFCDYTFYANEQRGGLQVVAASTTLKRYDEWRRPSDPSYTTPERVDSKVEAQGAELTIEAQECLPGVFVKVMKFETGVSEQGKRFIVLRSSYGPTGIADYRYEEP